MSPHVHRWPGVLARFLVVLAGMPLLVWAAGALWFDLPAPETVRKGCAALLIVGGGTLWVLGKSRGRLLVAIAVAAIAAWWFTLRPSNDRPWQPDVGQTAWAEIHGDEITFHNVRNCEYRTETDYTPRWEERTIRLSQITGIDFAFNYWGSPYMAHPIASFQFADAPPLCFSIETRKEIGESYSAIGGFYRQYELIYLVADERDVIRVRTNFRKGEEVFFYRLNITPGAARERLLEYISSLNNLRSRPRWYNAAMTNCTTSIRTQHAAAERAPWDWRMLLNGKADELMFERGAFHTGGLGFADLKARSLINDRARAAGDAADFSARIRAGGPSFSVGGGEAPAVDPL